MKITTELYLGDCKKELLIVSDNTVDLIFKSAPYPNQSKNTYGVRSYSEEITIVNFKWTE